MKNIVVIGPPGSGKGTQIGEMLKKMDAILVSGGDISRELSAKSPKIREIIAKGLLLDDNTILEAISDKLDAISAEKGVIFDGFPRTLKQAEGMNEILAHHGRTIDAVIYIELDESKIVERLTRRQVCSICGKNLPIGAEKCECGGHPTVRVDDLPATIMKRVQTFLDSTLPLVNYFQNKGILIEIDGDQKVAAVAADIQEKLGYVERR